MLGVPRVALRRFPGYCVFNGTGPVLEQRRGHIFSAVIQPSSEGA